MYIQNQDQKHGSRISRAKRRREAGDSRPGPKSRQLRGTLSQPVQSNCVRASGQTPAGVYNPVEIMRRGGQRLLMIAKQSLMRRRLLGCPSCWLPGFYVACIWPIRACERRPDRESERERENDDMTSAGGATQGRSRLSIYKSKQAKTASRQVWRLPFPLSC